MNIKKNYRTQKREGELPPPPTSVPEMADKTVAVEEKVVAETRDVLNRFRMAPGIRGHSRWEQDILKLLPLVSRKMAYDKVGVSDLPTWRKGFYHKTNSWWGVTYLLLVEFIHAFNAAVVDHQMDHWIAVRDRLNFIMEEGVQKFVADRAPTAGYVLRSRDEVHEERRAENERVRERYENATRARDERHSKTKQKRRK